MACLWLQYGPLGIGSVHIRIHRKVLRQCTGIVSRDLRCTRLKSQLPWVFISQGSQPQPRP
jgi:hypothetical protein